MDFIGKTIRVLSDFCEYVDAERKNVPSNKDLEHIFTSIDNLSCFLINIFASCFPSNAEYFELSYSISKEKLIKTKLKGFFILRLCKRIFLSEVWNSFENFFQTRLGRDDKIGRVLLKNYYGGEKNIPRSIDFLRRIRNSAHNNYKYGSKEDPVELKVGSKIYKLEPGKTINFAQFSDLISIVKECCKTL
ncbi:MAG: hypothetical protein A2117_01255 [Candidatus Wildermuthbacteria bacterium GWA2_46_15]|uniref:Uncharacterized protein n=1 Tax=Candidatus Wildermuthbacteria bacterium GWA2_46_15 TaxID=1802443 RepID=A0A1G2QQL8_9BACT|nr:MAG: hypothetical protein A2117_01255 [Candidatus Wildermuthbacteria bacterium GWA2_46_15]